MLLSFKANVYALPPTAVEGPAQSLRGFDLPSLIGESGGPPLFLEVLPVTFEAMQQQLFELPRCDCEPDGFFLVTGRTEDGTFWRLNGHMHEYQPDGADEPSMHRCELSGECPPDSLDRVLRTMGWPEAELAFELVKEGVTLREAAFRKWAESRVVPTSAPRVLVTDFTEEPPSAPSDLASEDPVDDAAEAPAELIPAAGHGRDDVALPHGGGEQHTQRTCWHLTFGTYGTRLHGDSRPTVDREHNEYGTPFVPRNDLRRERNESFLAGESVRLSQAQREFIEGTLPAICERGGWLLEAAAAQPDHVHVVCAIRVDVHSEKVRRLLKRWLTEALNEQWPDPNRPRWWAVQGSNKAIKEASYLLNAIAYVERQRATG